MADVDVPAVAVKDPLWLAEPGRAARGLYRVAWLVLAVFCRVWFRMRVEGREHLPKSGAFIVAPVHRSNLDTPIVSGLTRRQLRFMGKDSLWKVHSAVSWLFSALGAFPVSRDSADREALRRCQAVLESGQPLVLFPEGTRQFGPVVQPLKDGPAFLAARTGAPIVPVGIGGSQRAQEKGKKFIRPVKVVVVIGPPIVPPARDGATKRSAVRELTSELSAEIQRLFDEAQVKAGA
jgi:1-acyl-sn-glycerol-3-phosphate acyltransferase